jgi:hypothetical protein
MTDIVHMPETIAEGPSTLRELAYLEGIPIALPVLDSGGWKSLSPVEASGTMVPNAIVTARLSIANPVWSCFLTLDRCQCSFYLGQLSFALGTPIPLFLELSNDMAANFDLDSIDVRLVRTLTTRSVTGGVRKLDVARAAFWLAPGSSPHQIKLWGEVITGRSLTPSFVFSKCSVQVLYTHFFLSASLYQGMWAHGTWQYSIVLYPKHSPEQTETEPLLKEEVVLTLRNAPGVVPRSQAPPGVTPAQIERRSWVPPRDFPVDFGLVL